MYQKVILLGNLGRDPEIRQLQDGTVIANIALATYRRWNNAQGERQEETTWHRCVLFGKQAELAGQYLTKGSTVNFEGRIRANNYEKDGVKHYSTEIVVENMTFVGGKRADNPQQQPTNQQTYQQQPAQQAYQAPPAKPVTYNYYDDDIHF